MKRFLLKILLLISIVSSLLVVYNIYVGYAVRSCNIIPSGAQILAIGDSHIECAVDDILCPIFYNRAITAEPFYLNYHKLKDIMECNVTNDISSICLSYNFASCAIDRNDIFLSDDKDDYIGQYLSIYRKFKNLPSAFDMPLKDNPYVLLIRSYTPDVFRFKPLYSKTEGRYNGGHSCEYKTINNAPEGYVDKRIKQIVQDYKNLEYISPSQIKLLCIIADYAKNHDIELFLVNTPLHADYTAKVPDELKLFHGELAQKLHDEYGAIYLDYHTMEMPDSCFSDYNHLNSNGAKIFTPRLLEDVTLNMQRLGKW